VTEPTPVPTGIQAYDLAAPLRNLAAEIARQAKYAGPLSVGLSPAERSAHELNQRQQRAQRRREIAAAYEEAAADYNATCASLEGNTAALAALGVHLPVEGDTRVVCSECCESDLDDTVPVAWPCGTYTAIREATGA
jgi:hypothetical protein